MLQGARWFSIHDEGGGTYLNEANVMRNDWQESFYGVYYPESSEIKEKKKLNPIDVYYVTTAIRREKWTVEGDEKRRAEIWVGTDSIAKSAETNFITVSSFQFLF